MENEMQVQPSVELAYWVGVVQSDGCLNIYTDKKTNKINYRISVDVERKSLLMLKKFQDISNKILNCKIAIYECNNNVFKCTLGAKRLLELFKKLDIEISDPPAPPFWTLNKNDFFGAYLAGLLDGDGSINILEKTSKGRIRIFSKNRQNELLLAIKKILHCGCNTNLYGGCYHLEFKISSKNYKFLKNFVVSYLEILRKKEKLVNFIHNKFELKVN